jgi:ABC-type polar amino acid transport system ATPase subunit
VQKKTNESVIRVKGLQKWYGDKEILKGIDLELKQGEVVCIIGPSGSGKSTFLRCLNLLENPSGGTIQIYDEPIFSDQ